MRTYLRRTRVRLTLVYTGVVTVALCIGGAVFWLVFTDAAMGTIDSSLRGQAQVLSSGLRISGSTVLFNGGRILPSETAEGAPIGALVLSADGRVLDQAGNAIPAAAAQALALPAASSNRAPVIESRSFGPRHERILVQGIAAPEGHLSLILTHSLEEYDKTVGLTAVLLVTTVVILGLTAAVSGYWLAGRALRPVRIITATARDLSEHSLDRRLMLDLPPDELGSLATTFNQMLDRLEAAFTALRRFTADAAHELRSPLAALRAEVEVVLRRPRESSDYRAALEVVLTQTERLSGVTDQLLLLARADAGTLQPRRQSLDVVDLLEELADRWRPLASGSGVEIAVRVPAAGVIDADPTLLRRLLNNLLDNAIRHTPPRGCVTLSAEVGEGWVFAVDDSGPGVPDDLRPFLFERFRSSADRHHKGGVGLGLFLCAAIAQSHGGSIRLADPSTGHGARFVVTLPGNGATEGS
jgi:heavy metal sensor kinase